MFLPFYSMICIISGFNLVDFFFFLLQVLFFCFFVCPVNFEWMPGILDFTVLAIKCFCIVSWNCVGLWGSVWPFRSIVRWKQGHMTPGPVLGHARAVPFCMLCLNSCALGVFPPLPGGGRHTPVPVSAAAVPSNHCKGLSMHAEPWETPWEPCMCGAGSCSPPWHWAVGPPWAPQAHLSCMVWALLSKAILSYVFVCFESFSWEGNLVRLGQKQKFS